MHSADYRNSGRITVLQRRNFSILNVFFWLVFFFCCRLVEKYAFSILLHSILFADFILIFMLDQFSKTLENLYFSVRYHSTPGCLFLIYHAFSFRESILCYLFQYVVLFCCRFSWQYRLQKLNSQCSCCLCSDQVEFLSNHLFYISFLLFLMIIFRTMLKDIVVFHYPVWLQF